jgi:DNA polymerase III delta prime subunit
MYSSQSLLIATPDKNLATSHISELLKKIGVNPLDINLQTYEKDMGIEDVRNIQKTILLKPFRGQTKAVILDLYKGITLEAQNALLKMLEEPPNNTIMVITTTNKETILPTIISRCKVVVLQEKELKLIGTDLSRFQNDLEILTNATVGDKLKLAELLTKDKADSSQWLEKMAIFLKKMLEQENNNFRYLNFFKELQRTYKIVKSTNVSQRTAMENLFLSF